MLAANIKRRPGPSPVPSLRMEPYEEVHRPGPFEPGNAAPRTRRPTPPLAAPGLVAPGWENRTGVGAERDVAPVTPRRGSAEDGDEGPNPLIVAAKEGRASQVAAILRGYSRLSGSAHSLAVDCRTHHGETPLVLASWAGHEAIVRSLLDVKAQPDLVANDGNTALNCAAYKVRPWPQLGRTRRVLASTVAGTPDCDPDPDPDPDPKPILTHTRTHTRSRTRACTLSRATPAWRRCYSSVARRQTSATS